MRKLTNLYEIVRACPLCVIYASYVYQFSHRLSSLFPWVLFCFHFGTSVGALDWHRQGLKLGKLQSMKPCTTPRPPLTTPRSLLTPTSSIAPRPRKYSVDSLGLPCHWRALSALAFGLPPLDPSALWHPNGGFAWTPVQQIVDPPRPFAWLFACPIQLGRERPSYQGAPPLPRNTLQSFYLDKGACNIFMFGSFSSN